MSRSLERIAILRVKDLMKTDVVTVFESATMAEAAALLAANNLSGAPVVDVAGKCVGILTVCDFARRERDVAAASESLTGGIKHSVIAEPSQPVFVAGIRENRVGEHMTSTLQTIDAEATLVDAGRVFSGAHVHHLVVVDEFDRPAGMLTTMDLIDCIVELADDNTDQSA